MAIIPMQKVRLLVHKQTEPEILAYLQHKQIMEISAKTETVNQVWIYKNKETFTNEALAADLDFVVNFLEDYNPKSNIKKALEGKTVIVKEELIIDTVNNFNPQQVITKAIELEKKLNKAEQELSDNKNTLHLLFNWIAWPYPLDWPLETTHTATLLLSGSTVNLKDFSQKLTELKTPQPEVENISETALAVTVWRSELKSVTEMASRHDLTPITLPTVKTTGQTITEKITEMETDQEKLYQEIASIKNQLRDLTEQNLDKLKILSDYWYWEKNKHEVSQSLPGTNKVSIINGWIPQAEIDNLQMEVKKITPYAIIEKTEPQPEEIPPTKIHNNALVAPFETVTRLYGLPGTKNIDPTLFLSGFFFIFFGLCLTDVGYGLILLLLTGLILTCYKLPKDIKPMINLIWLGGLSSVIIGLFFGGYLGIDPQFLPAWARALQKFDPIGEPMTVFFLSLMMGVLQIIFGLILDIYRQAKLGYLKDGLLDQIPWLSLFTGLGLWAGGQFGNWSLAEIIAPWWIIISIIALVLTQGRKEDNLIKKLFMGVLSLYNSVGFLSDVLSYSRLLALGLATSAMAFSVNMIALMVKDMIPIVGWILMIAILIVGHLFNLTVNLLGAFVHSARLQFVEFFGKFITDTGRNFEAFGRQERHVTFD
ncbi:MAG: V-type ATP synthase subunit I [Patescibacteria group bacterium]